MEEGLLEEANAIGYRRKTTETESRSSIATVYACTERFPPKFLTTADTSQSNYCATGARGRSRVSGRLLPVYKASLVVSKPFGLGLARVR